MRSRIAAIRASKSGSSAPPHPVSQNTPKRTPTKNRTVHFIEQTVRQLAPQRNCKQGFAGACKRRHSIPHPMKIHSSCLLLLVALTIASMVSAKEPLPPPMPDFQRFSPPSDAGQSLRETLPPTGGAEAEPVSLLLTQTNDDKTQHWLLRLTPVEANPDEAGQTSDELPLRYFTTTGREIEFPRRRAFLEIATAGPMDEGTRRPSAKETELTAHVARISVYQSSLELGFDRTCRAVMRLRDGSDAAGLSPAQRQFGAQTEPYPDTVVEQGRAVAEILGLTAEEERAIIGSAPALIEFFRIAMETEETRDLLRDIIDLPVWSIVLRGGRFPEVGFQPMREIVRLDPEEWGLPPETAAYSIAYILRLNNRPALHFRLAVAPPEGNLAACAGIIGFAAMAPDGKGPRLFAERWMPPPPPGEE